MSLFVNKPIHQFGIKSLNTKNTKKPFKVKNCYRVIKENFFTTFTVFYHYM